MAIYPIGKEYATTRRALDIFGSIGGLGGGRGTTATNPAMGWDRNFLFRGYKLWTLGLVENAYNGCTL